MNINVSRVITQLPRVALALTLLPVAPGNAHALSEKDFRGACKVDLKKWKKRDRFGAAAISVNGHCAFSWQYKTLAEARKAALSSCAKKLKGSGRGKDCLVVLENKSPSKSSIARETCDKVAGQQSLDACTWLIGSKKLSRSELATYYNQRGRTHIRMDQADQALNDYTQALKFDSKMGWAFVNRAIIEYDRGQYGPALADFRSALKNYRKGGEDYREQATRSIKDIEDTLASIKSAPDEKLCAWGLAPSGTEWEKSARLSVYAIEAEKRGLSVDACRKLTSKG